MSTDQPEDRRDDDESRNRITELAENYAKFEAGARKSIKIMAVAIGVLSACTILALVGGAIAIDKIDDESKERHKSEQRQIAQIANEGAERRDQTCLLFEGQHKEDVIQLGRTYAYLVNLSDKELHERLNIAIIAQLPQVEQDAKDTAPVYCDEPNVGLPEPDPVIPKRPKVLTMILKAQASEAKK